MAFRFKFQSILKVRQIRLDGVKAGLARLYAKKEEMKSRLSYIESQIVVISEEIRQQKSFHIEEFRSRQNHLHNLRSSRSGVFSEIEGLDREIEKTKLALADALKEVKIMENLKEKHKLAYLQEQNRNMQRFLDDIAGQRHTR